MVKVVDVIVILLVIGLVAFSASTLVGVTSNYDINASTEFEDTYNRISDTQNTTERMEEEISGDGGSLSTAYAIFQGTGYILQMILGSLSTVKTMIYDTITALGIPPEVGLVIIGIVVAVLVVAILNFILGREQT